MADRLPPRPTSVEDLAAKAAQVIRDRGWNQHGYWSLDPKTGPVCASGAVNVVLSGQPMLSMAEWPEGTTDRDRCCDLKNEVSVRFRGIIRQRSSSMDNMISYNDTVATSPDDVIEVFEEIAHGG